MSVPVIGYDVTQGTCATDVGCMPLARDWTARARARGSPGVARADDNRCL